MAYRLAAYRVGGCSIKANDCSISRIGNYYIRVLYIKFTVLCLLCFSGALKTISGLPCKQNFVISHQLFIEIILFFLEHSLNFFQHQLFPKLCWPWHNRHMSIYFIIYYLIYPKQERGTKRLGLHKGASLNKNNTLRSKITTSKLLKHTIQKYKT